MHVTLYQNVHGELTMTMTMNPSNATSKVVQESTNDVTKTESTNKFDFTYKSVKSTSKAAKLADLCWARKSSDSSLCSKLEIEGKELAALFKSDGYRQSVFNLMLLQFNAADFARWHRTYPAAGAGFMTRMRVNKSFWTKSIKAITNFHAAVENGDVENVKMPAPRPVGIGSFDGKIRVKKA